jgi:hypothetical protein
MKLSEIAKTHPIIYDLIRQLLTKGKPLFLQVMNDGHTRLAGRVIDLTYEEDVDDYEFHFLQGKREHTYFTPGSHLETFTLKKGSREGGFEYWRVMGEWEQPKKVSESQEDDNEPLIYILLKKQLAKGELMVNNMGPCTVDGVEFTMDPRVGKHYIAVGTFREKRTGALRYEVLRFYPHEWDEMTLQEVNGTWWLAYEPQE